MEVGVYEHCPRPRAGDRHGEPGGDRRLSVPARWARDHDRPCALLGEDEVCSQVTEALRQVAKLGIEQERAEVAHLPYLRRERKLCEDGYAGRLGEIGARPNASPDILPEEGDDNPEAEPQQHCDRKGELLVWIDGARRQARPVDHPQAQPLHSDLSRPHTGDEDISDRLRRLLRQASVGALRVDLEDRRSRIGANRHAGEGAVDELLCSRPARLGLGGGCVDGHDGVDRLEEEELVAELSRADCHRRRRPVLRRDQPERAECEPHRHAERNEHDPLAMPEDREDVVGVHDGWEAVAGRGAFNCSEG